MCVYVRVYVYIYSFHFQNTMASSPHLLAIPAQPPLYISLSRLFLNVGVAPSFYSRLFLLLNLYIFLPTPEVYINCDYSGPESFIFKPDCSCELYTIYLISPCTCPKILQSQIENILLLLIYLSSISRLILLPIHVPKPET